MGCRLLKLRDMASVRMCVRGYSTRTNGQISLYISKTIQCLQLRSDVITNQHCRFDQLGIIYTTKLSYKIVRNHTMLYTVLLWYIKNINVGCCAKQEIRPKHVLNWNLAKSRSSITSVQIVKSVWSLSQSMEVSVPCSVQNFKTIWSLIHRLWANEVSRDLGLRWVSGGYPILHSNPGSEFIDTHIST